MATFSLDQLKADVESNYKALELEVGKDDVIELSNVLRLPKEDRTKVAGLLDGLQEAIEDNDLDAIERDALEVLVLAAGKRGKDLEKLLDGNVALIIDLLQKWQEGTQAGEADSSKS